MVWCYCMRLSSVAAIKITTTTTEKVKEREKFVIRSMGKTRKHHQSSYNFWRNNHDGIYAIHCGTACGSEKIINRKAIFEHSMLRQPRIVSFLIYFYNERVHYLHQKMHGRYYYVCRLKFVFFSSQFVIRHSFRENKQ